MLLSANSSTKQICVSVRNDKCCDAMQLRITNLQCEKEPEFQYCYNACGEFEHVEVKKESEHLLTLVYDMFDRDENGNVCFLLDNLFVELVCGRYNAEIIACGCSVKTFQIDKRDNAKVAQIKMDNRLNCCGGKYGC